MKDEYEIKTPDLLAGKLPQRANALVLEWASLHKNELLENWEKAKIPSSMNKIEPLN